MLQEDEASPNTVSEATGSSLLHLVKKKKCLWLGNILFIVPPSPLLSKPFSFSMEHQWASSSLGHNIENVGVAEGTRLLKHWNALGLGTRLFLLFGGDKLWPQHALRIDHCGQCYYQQDVCGVYTTSWKFKIYPHYINLSVSLFRRILCNLKGSM